MSVQLAGKIAIFNIDGTIDMTGAGLLDPDESINRSASLTDPTNPVDLVKDGTILTRAYANNQRRVAVSFVPYDPDNPGNLATLKSKVKLPAKGSIVTLAGFASADFNGNWNYETGSMDPQDGGYLTMSLTITQVLNAAGTWEALTPQ